MALFYGINNAFASPFSIGLEENGLAAARTHLAKEKEEMSGKSCWNSFCV